MSVADCHAGCVRAESDRLRCACWENVDAKFRCQCRADGEDGLCGFCREACTARAAISHLLPAWMFSETVAP